MNDIQPENSDGTIDLDDRLPRNIHQPPNARSEFAAWLWLAFVAFICLCVLMVVGSLALRMTIYLWKMPLL